MLEQERHILFTFFYFLTPLLYHVPTILDAFRPGGQIEQFRQIIVGVRNALGKAGVDCRGRGELEILIGRREDDITGQIIEPRDFPGIRILGI